MERITVLGVPIRYTLFKTHLNGSRIPMRIAETIKESTHGKLIAIAEPIMENLPLRIPPQKLANVQWMLLCFSQRDAEVKIANEVETTLELLHLLPEGDTNEVD